MKPCSILQAVQPGVFALTQNPHFSQSVVYGSVCQSCLKDGAKIPGRKGNFLFLTVLDGTETHNEDDALFQLFFQPSGTRKRRVNLRH